MSSLKGFFEKRAREINITGIYGNSKREIVEW